MANILDEFLILFRTRLTGDGIQRVNKQLGQTRNSLFKTSNLFKTFFAYDMYGAIRNLIPSMIDVSKKMGAMEARFYAVTGSTKLAREELSFVKAEADRLGLTFLDTADNYSIFYASVKNTLGSDTARNIFTNWAESFRILHIDPAKQERILYALREMASKGKIYMQDLANQLGSHVPDAMGIAAKSMGYFGKDAISKFRKDITAGKVDVQKFLVVFSEAINDTYVSADKLANAMNKPDAQLATLANRWQSFQIAFAEAGFEKDLVSSLKLLNETLKNLESMAKPLYELAKLLMKLVALKFLVDLINKGAILFKTMKEIPQYIKAFTTLWGLLSGSTMGAIGSLFTVAGWAALIASLGLVLAYILKTFFPNIWLTLSNYWWTFWWDVEDAIKSAVAWFDTTGLGKWIKSKNEEGEKNNKINSLSGNALYNSVVTKGGTAKPSINNLPNIFQVPKVEVTNNITVPETASTAQEIGDYLANSEKIAYQNALHPMRRFGNVQQQGF